MIDSELDNQLDVGVFSVTSRNLFFMYLFFHTSILVEFFFTRLYQSNFFLQNKEIFGRLYQSKKKFHTSILVEMHFSTRLYQSIFFSKLRKNLGDYISQIFFFHTTILVENFSQNFPKFGRLYQSKKKFPHDYISRKFFPNFSKFCTTILVELFFHTTILVETPRADVPVAVAPVGQAARMVGGKRAFFVPQKKRRVSNVQDDVARKSQ